MSQFLDSAIFYSTEFHGAVNFNGSRFSTLDFTSTLFQDSVSFMQCVFNGKVNFTNAVLSKKISLYKAKVTQNIDLTNVYIAPENQPCMIDLRGVDTKKIKLRYDHFVLYPDSVPSDKKSYEEMIHIYEDLLIVQKENVNC